MRVPLRAALAAPVALALALSACASSDPDDTGSGDELSVDDGASGSEDPSGADSAAPLEPVSLPDGVAATVGDDEISVDQVEEQLALRDIATIDEDVASAGQVLQQLVQITLVEAAAERELGLDLATELDGPAIEARVQQLVAAAGGQEAFEATASQQGITAENAAAIAREDARLQLLIEAVQAALAEQLPADAVDEDALRAEFEADPSAYQSSDVAHILLDTEQEALDALARLEDGEDFGELAAELSTGPSGPAGGELGVNPRGTFVDEFSAAVYAEDTEVGEVVGPVETEFGFHLIRVNDIVTPTVDEIIADAREQAAATELQSFAQEAFTSVEIAVDEQFGVWDPASATIVPA